METRGRAQHGAAWTASEDDMLRRLTGGAGERTRVARELGRTRGAVDVRMAKLGLIKPRRVLAGDPVAS